VDREREGDMTHEGVVVWISAAISFYVWFNDGLLRLYMLLYPFTDISGA
jgi:hypothetical protein